MNRENGIFIESGIGIEEGGIEIEKYFILNTL
jgi:hypothetical protein